MGYCVNHPDVKTLYRCAACGAYICTDCLEKYEMPNKTERIGFCSEACRTRYLENRDANKAKAFKVLRTAIGLFLLSTLIGLMYPYDPINFYGLMRFDPYWIVNTVISVFIPVPWRFASYVLVLSVWKMFKAYDIYINREDMAVDIEDIEIEPEEENIDLENGKFYCRVDDLEENEKTKVLNKLKQSAPYYIYVGKDVYKAMLKQLKFYLEIYGYNKEENLRDENIYIGITGSGELYLYFNDSYEFYHFVNLLDCMNMSLDLAGYASLNNELYNFKSNGDDDYVYAANSLGKCIEIDVSNGRITDDIDEVVKYQKPDPKYDELVKILDCRIKIEKEVPGPEW